MGLPRRILGLILLTTMVAPVAAAVGPGDEASPCSWEDDLYVATPTLIDRDTWERIDLPTSDDVPWPSGFPQEGIPHIDPNDLDLFVVCVKNGQVKIMCDVDALAREAEGAQERAHETVRTIQDELP